VLKKKRIVMSVNLVIIVVLLMDKRIAHNAQVERTITVLGLRPLQHASHVLKDSFVQQDRLLELTALRAHTTTMMNQFQLKVVASLAQMEMKIRNRECRLRMLVNHVRITIIPANRVLRIVPSVLVQASPLTLEKEVQEFIRTAKVLASQGDG
jgi:hypothetical protein